MRQENYDEKEIKKIESHFLDESSPFFSSSSGDGHVFFDLPMLGNLRAGNFWLVGNKIYVKAPMKDIIERIENDGWSFEAFFNQTAKEGKYSTYFEELTLTTEIINDGDEYIIYESMDIDTLDEKDIETIKKFRTGEIV